MNKTIPNSDPSLTRKKQSNVRKSRLRAIDAGTRYDITGNLRRLARSIERGDLGAVHHIVIGVSSKLPDSARHLTAYAYGTESVSEMFLTVEALRGILSRGAGR